MARKVSKKITARRTAKRKPADEGGTVDALAELGPFSKALASVATREEPERADAPPELVAAAHVLRGVWLALHRGDDAALREWAKGAIGYLEKTETRGVESKVCKMFPLPPIKGVNRADAARTLFQLTEIALSHTTTTEIADYMVFAVGQTFPNLVPAKWSSQWSDPRPKESCTSAIERDHRLGRLSPRKLIMLTLAALGMPDTEIASTLKSVGE